MSDQEYHARNTLLISLVAAQVLHETLDELENTDYFRQTLKGAVNRVQKELTKTCDQHIDKLFEMDEEMMRDLQNGIEQIGSVLAKTKNPAVLVEIGKIIERRDW